MRRDERGQTVPERLGRVRDKRVNRAKNALRKPAGRSAKVRAARAAAEKGVMKITWMADYFRTLRQSAGRMYEMRQEKGETEKEGGEKYSAQDQYDEETKQFLSQYPSAGLKYKNISDYSKTELKNIQGYKLFQTPQPEL